MASIDAPGSNESVENQQEQTQLQLGEKPSKGTLC
jgi:hypothetical protein